MLARPSDRIKKTELLLHKNANHPPQKRTMMQSHQYGNIRRHSVYGGHDYESITVRVSSKQMKSLPKYKSIAKHETPMTQRKDREREKNRYHHGNSHREDICTSPQKIFTEKRAYRYLNMIGKGGFGKVWKVQHLASGRLFAMKQMSKAIVVTKRSIESILNERQFLSTLRHKFIVNMLYAFQDDDCLYLLMHLMQGGDLRYHLSKGVSFSQGETKFMAASILLALDYLHGKMVIHRDVKPENIVFDRQGYAYLTDLGIAKHLRPNNGEDTSGTPGYMAPEVMFHHNHRYEVDFYALGVILYEIMMGKRPYLGKSRQQIKQKIKEKQVIIKKKQIPEGWSIEAADFVNKLLQRKPVERLGWAGVEEVKQHPWLRHFPWDDLLSGRLPSPTGRFYNYAEVRYRPTQNDTNYNRLLNKNRDMLKKGAMQDYFEGYSFEVMELKQVNSTAQNTKMY